VRYLAGGPSNPLGANVEVKVIDPSANPYLATAAILGLALDGIERKLPLPPETTVDPARLTDDHVRGQAPSCWRRSRPTRSMRSTNLL
jgi:glutamine synthetase